MITILPLYYVIEESGIYHPYVKDRTTTFVFNGAFYEKKMETKLKLNLEGVFFTVNRFTCLPSIFLDFAHETVFCT